MSVVGPNTPAVLFWHHQKILISFFFPPELPSHTCEGIQYYNTYCTTNYIGVNDEGNQRNYNGQFLHIVKLRSIPSTLICIIMVYTLQFCFSIWISNCVRSSFCYQWNVCMVHLLWSKLKVHFYSWLPLFSNSHFMGTLKLELWSLCEGFYSVKDYKKIACSFPLNFLFSMSISIGK